METLNRIPHKFPLSSDLDIENYLKFTLKIFQCQAVSDIHRKNIPNNLINGLKQHEIVLFQDHMQYLKINKRRQICLKKY